MKRLITVILVLAIAMSASASFAEQLSENEQNYLGAWSMYAKGSGGTIYVFIITFLDNMEVVQRTMTFKNGTLTSDNKASGIWGGFTSDSILLTLAGTDMAAIIKEDGYLYLKFFKDMSLGGIFSKCPDMTSVLGW